MGDATAGEATADAAAPTAVRDFLLPDLGEGLEDASIVEWFVAPGDPVALNQILCVVETAKASVEVPSPYAGTVVVLGAEPGGTVRVGELLVRVAVGAGRAPTLVGYGFDPALDRSRRVGTGPEVPVGPSDGAAPKPLAPPPVRRLAQELGVDLATIAPGSGPGGVVTRADVQAAAVGPAGAARDDTGADAAGTTVPVQGVRARIASRITTSRARIPDATGSVVVDCTRLRDLQASLRLHAERRGETPVGTFAILCRLMVEALRTEPELNATFVEDGPAIRRHAAIHLGIATATDRGVLVPVVRDAHRRGVFDLAAEIARLADRARAGTATPAELTGSTFTVSNFGVFGIDEAIPVINHPEAAILGVGAIAPRPHVVDGAVVARHTAHLTLAFDHRVADGAEAGRLLALLRELVEHPEVALLGP